jgi:hypothetical protein
VNRFETGQLVRVTDPAHPCFGNAGRVWKLSLKDQSALIQMDDAVPDNVRRFPAGFAGDGDRNIRLLPDQCERIY